MRSRSAFPVPVGTGLAGLGSYRLSRPSSGLARHTAFWACRPARSAPTSLDAVMTDVIENSVTVTESGLGPYAQFVTVGRHVMGADEPEPLGGRDTGASPYEYLLAGLGACTAMTLRMYATRKSWPLEKIAVELRHDKI